MRGGARVKGDGYQTQKTSSRIGLDERCTVPVRWKDGMGGKETASFQNAPANCRQHENVCMLGVYVHRRGKAGQARDEVNAGMCAARWHSIQRLAALLP